MTLLFAAILATFDYGPDASWACSVGELRRMPGYRWSVERIAQFVDSADVIVHVRAVARDSVRSSGYDSSAWVPGVRFESIEALRGGLSSQIVLGGAIVDSDDFNTLDVPYRLVRRAGQRGDCFASEYRLGGEYLLLLQRNQPGLTPYWWPLAPANEQIRGRDDPWVQWVRARAERRGAPLESASASVPSSKRARHYVIPGALLGALALSVALGPQLYAAEIGSPWVVYGGTAVVGGLAGALIGRIVFEARR